MCQDPFLMRLEWKVGVQEWDQGLGLWMKGPADDPEMK